MQNFNPPEQKSCKILMGIPMGISNGNSHLKNRWLILDNFLKYMHDDLSKLVHVFGKKTSYLRIFIVKLQNLANFINQNLFQMSQKDVEQQKIILLLRSLHYHLQVRANPKKMAQKNDAIFSIYGRNGINPWHFFLILT